MGQINDEVQNSFNNGEISPGAGGRWDLAKYSNSVKVMENWLLKQVGGAIYRPGTRYVETVKDETERTRLLKFIYSTTQTYVIEAGDLYFRFYTDDGRLESPPGTPVELVTVFALANLRKIKYTQNADTMYLFTGTYPVQKLTRTSATTFTITEVLWKRGPFLDSNTNTSITITASADTGAGITLTASSAIFTTGASGHTGSLWRIKDGVVKITATASTTSATATVQAEPDGTAGNLGTGGAAQTDWAEGAWSAVRGYPSCGVFHDGRLWASNTTYQVGGLWGSVAFEYENHAVGTAEDEEAIVRELNAEALSGVSAIRSLSSSPNSLQAFTAGGPYTIGSGTQGIGITPTNITAKQDNQFGAADLQARRMFHYVYYVQNNLKRILESGYNFEQDQNASQDTQKLAEHILEALIDDTNIFLRGDSSTSGVYDMDTQQSPVSRLWALRDDGQIAVLTRNPYEEINGWCRILAGKTVSCDGKSGTGQFESIVIIPREGFPDQIWVIVNRIIDGSVRRYVEFFTDEDFKYDWDAVRLDCSLTYDNPIEITDITDSIPNVVTAASHGLSTNDQVRLDGIVGKHQLNGTKWIITVLTGDTFELTTEVE